MNINKSQYINDICENSRRLLTAIDKKHKDFIIDSNKNIAVKEYQQYLSTILENPVMTTIIMNNTLKQNPIKNNESVLNLISLEKQPEIDTLVKKSEHLYHIHKHTGHIRSTIIENGRISPEKVTPKLEGLKKIFFKIKLIKYYFK